MLLSVALTERIFIFNRTSHFKVTFETRPNVQAECFTERTRG